MSVQEVDVAILGAGAAGMLCAASAGRRGRRVIVLEHSETIGAKILISGGGRCNFTNIHIAPDRFISENPHFCKSALSRYTQNDFISLIEKHKIPYYEKTLGQLFCEGAGAAKRIVAMLRAETASCGVDLRTKTPVLALRRDVRFRLDTPHGEIVAESLVVATGGLSIPKLGATDAAFQIARQFGVPIAPPRPALVPLTLPADALAWSAPLAGLAAEASVAAARGPAFREALLFTHRGLSGPAVLQASSYWRAGEPIAARLLPDRDAGDWLTARKRARPKAQLKAILAEALPARLADALAGADARPIGDWRDKDLTAFAEDRLALRLTPSGCEGYAKAEVTAGGISTDALDQKTMMVKSVPGLFFVGEAVDVTGWLGGYNFQWAWSSGWVAGQAA